jgi:transcriptional regulator with XRE-family HTH domain
MTRPVAPMVARQGLANALRRIRTDAGATLEQAANRLEYSNATLSRIENAQKLPKARDVRELCDLFEMTDEAEVERLLGLLDAARESPWYSELGDVDDDGARAIDMESSANRIEQFASSLIPGLLQTRGYMRVFIEQAVQAGRDAPLTAEDLDQRIEIRLTRQRLLTRAGGPEYAVVLDEAALRRQVGGPEVMREQVLHLVELSATPRLTIRVVPLEAGAHPGQLGSFTIIHLPVEDVSDAVYVDSVAGQTFLDSPDDLARYGRVFRAVESISLDEQPSRDLCLQLARRA